MTKLEKLRSPRACPRVTPCADSPPVGLVHRGPPCAIASFESVNMSVWTST